MGPVLARLRGGKTDMTEEHTGYWMCECRVSHNFFVRTLGKHFRYNGDDAEFLFEFGDELRELGAEAQTILEELRRQREERLRAPEKSLERARRIAQEYQPLHPGVYRLKPESFLDEAFREMVAELQKPGSGAAARLKSRKLVQELRPGLFTFPVFTEAFCDQLEAELGHFQASGLPRSAPNTMNRYGIIMSELGFGPELLDPFIFQYLDIIAQKLLPAFCETLDSYRAFTVLYDAEKDGDRELAMHYDNAEITLNVNIGGTWEGGQVAFYGLATREETEAIEVALHRGHGVLHAGLELHKAQPITQGRRHNLIMWCRSSGIRNDLCPMCFEQPQVLPTNKFFHEGFSVPPCSPAVVKREMSEDLYD
ncbi:ogfod2 [Symbiodinium necroappetens]|uniref:Ogfod2 protein n=1 Tax=Symbiodinium necroappetens TaxID=1628268 RepID=A0A812V2J1_9DINO|nr:ogfod2 [Symbiodinium necroappetens]